MGRAFQPNGPTVTLAVTTTTSVTASFAPTATQIKVLNPAASASIAFIAIGTGAGLVATTADMPIPIGGWITLTKGGMDRVAAICAGGGTATLYITPGEEQ